MDDIPSYSKDSETSIIKKESLLENVKHEEVTENQSQVPVKFVGSSMAFGHQMVLKSKAKQKSSSHFMPVDEYNKELSVLQKRPRKEFEQKRSLLLKVEPVEPELEKELPDLDKQILSDFNSK